MPFPQEGHAPSAPSGDPFTNFEPSDDQELVFPVYRP